MLPMRTVLNPTDFSTGSEAAFRLASALARDYGAHLIVLHVLPGGTDGGSAVGDAPAGLVRAELEEKLYRCRMDLRIDVEPRLREGDPASEILRATNEWHCDLVVMGTHGRMDPIRPPMGSVAESVMRAAPCPVLVVRSELVHSKAHA